MLEKNYDTSLKNVIGGEKAMNKQLEQKRNPYKLQQCRKCELLIRITKLEQKIKQFLDKHMVKT